MTDIGRMAHLAPARTQLGVSAYFDPALFAQEQASIFTQETGVRCPMKTMGGYSFAPNLASNSCQTCADIGRP